MNRPWRLPIVAACFLIIVIARAASSQTVIVRNAGRGASVQLALNGIDIPAVAPVAGSDATFALDVVTILRKPSADIRVVVDTCGARRRLFLDESGRQPPASEGACLRKVVPDIFVFQPVTTLVVDVGGDNPQVLVRQGPAPPEWLGLVAAKKARTWQPAPRGLIISGAAGYATISEALPNACGDAPQCAEQGRNGTTAVGASFWLTRFLSAEAGYMQLARVSIAGGGTVGSSGAPFHFTTTIDARLLTLIARSGGQAGPLRMYALGGAIRQASTSSTTQTIDPTTADPGGVETFAIKTQGWGWLGGGGIETWFGNRIGVYGEGGLAALKGSNVTKSGEGALDDQLIYIVAGVRVHLGR